MIPPIDIKRCGACGEVKPHAEFNRNATRRDGLQKQCRPCQRKMYRELYAPGPMQHAALVERTPVECKVCYDMAHRRPLRKPCRGCQRRWAPDTVSLSADARTEDPRLEVAGG